MYCTAHNKTTLQRPSTAAQPAKGTATYSVASGICYIHKIIPSWSTFSQKFASYIMLILQTYTQKFKIHNPTLHARHILPSELTLLLLPELCLHTTCKSEAAHTYFGPILAHTGTHTLSPTVLSEIRERVNITHTRRLSLFNLFHQMKFHNKKS